MIHVGDCLEVMRSMADNSVDAIVTDPPYALPGGFMGKEWDRFDGREDAAFGYWLAGFTDGEGRFRVQRHPRGTHSCSFQIKLRRDDRSALERIRRFVGHGTVRQVEGDGNSNPQAVYVVQDKAGCEVLVGLFRRFPLTAKKAVDFEVWADAVDEWLNRPRGSRWSGQSDQERAAALKARLEDVRRYAGVPWSGHRFQDWVRQWATECLRVLKPGGHLLAFGATRQCHRLTAGIEDAGFEIRDMIAWVYGSGFPKSHNGPWGGTALKPALEPITVARKPLEGTVAANWAEHGTGSLNIDACRVGADGEQLRLGAGGMPRHHVDTPRTRAGEVSADRRYADNGSTNFAATPGPRGGDPDGRWPANLIHDGSAEVLADFPEAASRDGKDKGRKLDSTCYGKFDQTRVGPSQGRREKGSAARFFYCAKASRQDRNEGLASSTSPAVSADATMRDVENADWAARNGNHHPTVKPTDLMRYLCRLVTPAGGLVLDPFMGSGSTGKAAALEGFRFIGIEKDPTYAAIAEARIAAAIAAAADHAAKPEAMGDLFDGLDEDLRAAA